MCVLVFPPLPLCCLQPGVVLVHCNAGISRSTSIVIGYLMLREGLSFEEALGQVKHARPSVCPNAGFYRQLKSYAPGRA